MTLVCKLLITLTAQHGLIYLLVVVGVGLSVPPHAQSVGPKIQVKVHWIKGGEGGGWGGTNHFFLQ